LEDGRTVEAGREYRQRISDVGLSDIAGNIALVMHVEREQVMDGWTEFDMARIENELKEARLHRKAMMPKLTTRHPVRSALARTLMFVAQKLSTEHVPAAPARNLVVGTSET
jgi:hypothetical protein